MIVNAEVEDFKIAQGEEIEAITEWCFKVEEQLRKLLDGPKSEPRLAFLHTKMLVRHSL
jgi:hypothetical protein